MPDSFAETPDGHLMVANGMSRMLRWDGLTQMMELAGLTAPATACTLSGAGQGDIVGTYRAFVRFLDKDGNTSSFSPVSADYTAAGSSGTITGVTNATPIQITSPGHGLTSGVRVSVANVGGEAEANGDFTITVLDPDNFLLNETVASGDWTGGGSWISGVAAIVYTNVPVPSEARVTRRQLLRNTDGEASDFFVDVDTTDLVSTTFASSLDDLTLAAQIDQAVLDDKGFPLANRFTPPPTHKAVLCNHLGRMFACVEVNYTQGCVATTFGSATVQGIGTEWTAEMAGRYLYVLDALAGYQIASVNPTAQTLTLTATYADATNPYARYGIRPAPAERRLVYYTEAGLPEAWPALNALSVQEDDDELTGMLVNGSFLYILERRHIYRFTFQNDPATDGFIFLSCDRGCINNRSWVVVEGKVYMLDEKGLHAFSGGPDSEPISTPIQDLFRRLDGAYTINWKAADLFHAVHYAEQETIRWFVCLSGDYLPRHCIAYNYRLQRFWIEGFALGIGSSVPATIDSERCVLLGAEFAKVLRYWYGTLDGPDPSAGTVRGTATSVSRCSLTDDNATFAASKLVNAPLVIVDGKGKGQVRRIVAVSGQTIKVRDPWTRMPDSTSVYQIGGISWKFRSGWWRFLEDESQNQRRIAVYFLPIAGQGFMNIKVFKDYSPLPETLGTSFDSRAGDGVKSTAGLPDLEVDLTKPRGYAQKYFSGHREYSAEGDRFQSIELSGVTNLDVVSVLEASLDSVESGK